MCARVEPDELTVTFRNSAGPTGQPACHDRPSCTAVTGATCAWNGGEQRARPRPAYSGLAHVDARARTRDAACAQQVRVVAPSTSSTVATVSLVECGQPSAAVARPRRLPRALRTSPRRRRDDTARDLPLGPVVYGLAPNPGTSSATTGSAAGTGGTRTRAHRRTTSSATSAAGPSPRLAAASEALWRATVAYRLFAVLEYNTARVPGRGSAMFLHVDTATRRTAACRSPSRTCAGSSAACDQAPRSRILLHNSQNPV